MKEDKMNKKYKNVLHRMERFFSSWKFPVFTLSVLFFFGMLVIAISLIPVSPTGIGAFAEDFKTWCLGYDPATGEIESIYLVMFIVQPVILSAFILGFWFTPLKELRKTGLKQAAPYIAVGITTVFLIATTFPSLYTPSPQNELPFPAEEIRTSLTPPGFKLINQDKDEIQLVDFKGQVVIVTAVYASCTETCPIILEQAKEVLNELTKEEAAQVQLMALTMDPDKDTPKMLKMTAEHYGLEGTNQHLLTGETNYINDILDRLNILRERREDGRIDHANIFLLIDKTGHIAYRFTIGERQKKWLLKATKLLAGEESEAATMSSL
ncbi:MAG: SCO family protein [Balneolaceae bacterium]|nr:SCO family protein [Balneolaceae bacterium]